MLLLSFPTKVCICIYPSNSPSFQGVSFESFQLLLCARGDTATVAVGAADRCVERWKSSIKDGDGWGWMMDGGSLGEKKN